MTARRRLPNRRASISFDLKLNGLRYTFGTVQPSDSAARSRER